MGRRPGRGVGSALVAGACLSGALGIGPARSAPSPYLDVRIAKTADAIRPFGLYEPARPDRRVVVRFSHDTGDGFQRVATKMAALNGARDSDGDGRADSAFSASFERPDAGTCRIVVVFKRPPKKPVRDEETFGCAIPGFGTGDGLITGTGHEPVSIDLLVAETDEQRAYGLSFRRFLAGDRGMAFLFGGDTTARFWMKDTLIPLSIAFFDQQGTIVDIQDMDPCLEEDEPCPTYGPPVAYQGALEVNQGAFDAWEVQVGDRIVITR